ncbi:MAG TPA: cob(I)yrinic acid a,c-diamide adenosyltransferase [Thermoplasmata archaeon]|nr:cob(I)yrinic acid a,c-diamide adenosyltransferase [Thermoplasmata archaeon]
MAAGGENIPRLYTRTGDDGTTGLAFGARVAKESARIRAYGAFDELGAHLGLLETSLPPSLNDFRPVVRQLQHELFIAQSELAVPPAAPSPPHRIEARHVVGLESAIDRFDGRHPPLHTFVLAGGSAVAAQFHIARTVARRAERELWRLHRGEAVRPELLRWTNRLSDLLFAMALAANAALQVTETAPDYTV